MVFLTPVADELRGAEGPFPTKLVRLGSPAQFKLQ